MEKHQARIVERAQVDVKSRKRAKMQTRERHGGDEGDEDQDQDSVQTQSSDKHRCQGQDGNQSDGDDHSSEEEQNEGADQEFREDQKQKSGQGCAEGSCKNKTKGSSLNGNEGLDREQNESPVKGRNHPDKNENRENHCKKNTAGSLDARSCLEGVNNALNSGNHKDTIEALESFEQALEETDVNETTSMSLGNLVVYLHKPKGPFKGLKIYANEHEATSDKSVNNSRVNVWLPTEINVGANNTIVFSMLTWARTNESSDIIYENRLVGLSVRGKNISGLRERVEITMKLTTAISETQEPRCVFLDFSTKNYSSHGCDTLLRPDQSAITCSCDHLTYFGVLLVSADLSPEHLEILSYITLIGCSLSLLVLTIAVLLFIANRKLRADVSMKVHINLVIALILLNAHFLPSQAVAALSSYGLCLYIALALHFSLLSTFSWMALEGFHLYLLLVRVFNIYVRRYLLKLSVFGWGVPTVIVVLVVIIDRDSYGVFPLDSSNPNSTEICYIVNDTVKMVTTVGVFSLVFLFNLIMLGVTIRQVVSLYKRKQSGHADRAKRDICTLLGITALLGIPWGLIFFSFGYLTVPGLYAFCILNSLQGVFIFLWFAMSLRKIGKSDVLMISKTQSSHG
ncbi:adhesion G-protein coupled receptor G5-like [Cheilinus undulatus]|uniref:adhesion G-protein coupled receptor G5-like n=1 Tax=Cheilinus undulatus TaxID=241271 RepID=UPI001BD56566|nr:adhesion G-protein coupled receptor G5-like [Cheilinus undulatus]